MKFINSEKTVETACRVKGRLRGARHRGRAWPPTAGRRRYIRRRDAVATSAARHTRRRDAVATSDAARHTPRRRRRHESCPSMLAWTHDDAIL